MTLALPQQATLDSLEWGRLIGHLRDRLRTPYGHRALEALAPLPDAEAVRASLRRVGEMMALEADYGELELDAVGELDDLLTRAVKQGRLEGQELRRVLATQTAARDAARRLRLPPAAPELARLAEGMEPLAGLCAELSRSVGPDGELDERTYPHLRELRNEIHQRRDAVHQHLDGLLRARQLEPMLQERIYTLRGNRYVLPIKADFRGQLKGIVHDVSSSGATIFVEPQAVVDETNALILAQRQYRNAVEAILDELSGHVGEAEPELCANLAWLGEVDRLGAMARLASDYEGTLPEVAEGERIDLCGVAHPLMLLEGARAVRNDVALGDGARCLVISGANTGGKTVLLKAVGLCLLLVAHGLPVPARAGSRLDRFDDVGAEVGDWQNLAQSLSTFSGQIEALARMLERAGPRSVVLIDEIFTGTEPQQGSALAGTYLEMLVDRGALALVTTHYSELKSLAGERDGFANASVAFDPERLVPTFHLQVGLPGSSYAFSIARRYGLPDGLVDEAERRVRASGHSPEALLEQLHRTEAALHHRGRLLAQREADAEHLRGQLRRRETELAEREREVRRRERGRVSEEVRRARREIAAVMHDLERVKTLSDAQQVRERLSRLEAEAARELAPPEAEAPPPLDVERLAPGDVVYLPALGQTATFQERLEKGRMARVKVGALSFDTPVDELAPPPQPQRRPASRGAVTAGGVGGPPRGPGGIPVGEAPPEAGEVGPLVPTGDNTLDVRGLRLAEAWEKTEQFLDLCVVKHVSPVLLIHGHGTGRLKQGLRQHLSRSPYVAAFRPGERQEGADGVTVVALRL